MKAIFKKTVSVATAVTLAVSGMAGLSSAFAATGSARALAANAVSARTASGGTVSWGSVKQLGRTHVMDDGNLWLVHSGTGIEFEYQGAGFDITVLGDNNAAADWNTANPARVAVYVDGQEVADQRITQAEQTISVEGDTSRPVTVRLVKLSESAASTIRIKPITIAAGETVTAAPEKDYKVEFIGDSITCGQGVETTLNAGTVYYSTEYENITKSYSYKTAELLDADYSMVSAAGYGVISGYSSDGAKKETETLPQYYEKLGYSWSWFGNDENTATPEKLEWDFGQFRADAVVINLGQNDASYCYYAGADETEQGRRRQEFREEYIDFLSMIRKDNPDAEIFCTLGIMGATMYPDIEAAVASYRNTSGDDKVHTFQYGTYEGNLAGGGYHPTESAHAEAARDLAAEINKVRNTTPVDVPSGLAVYNVPVTATGSGSCQWYIGTKASGEDAVAIAGATSGTYTPLMEHIGGWLFCAENGDAAAEGEKFRVVASTREMEIAFAYKPGNSNSNANEFYVANTVSNYGTIDPAKWAPTGYVYVEYKITNTGKSPTVAPALVLQTWSVSGKSTQNIAASETGKTQDGNLWAKYNYTDMVNGWYNDADFNDVKAVRVNVNKAGLTTEDCELVSIKYAGPTLTYGDLGEPVTLRGNASGYQYQFSRHVGGQFEATDLRTDDEFYVEYTDDKRDTLRLVAQSHSAGAGDVNNSYAVIDPYETGATGTGYYSKFRVSDMAAKFGKNFRYLDGIRISFTDDSKLTNSASVYLFKGSGALVDDISKDGYDDAVMVPWTLYDDTDKKGIAVIGASITQNPLVTPLAMSGEPFFAERGSWAAMLDRTDIVTYGIGSQTTDDIAARFHEVLDYGYEKIVIQCGNNDLGAFNGANAPAEAAAAEAANYKKMLDAATQKGIPVYIVSLNPVKSEATNSKIPTVIAKLKELSAEYNGMVTYIDVYDDFKDPATGFSRTDLVMSDGLHPVAKGYAIYAKYLKEALASADEADTSLISLSWREESKVNSVKKTTVTGFESGDSGDKTYEVNLGSVAKDAAIRLYVTADNLNAAVNVKDGEVKTEEYTVVEERNLVKTDSYIPVTLTDGSSTIQFTVTSADGSNSSTYTVNFTSDGTGGESALYEGEEKYQTLTADNCIAGNWPYILWNDMNVASDQTLRIEFDVEVENKGFTSLYIEPKANWNNIGGTYLTVGPKDFDENNLYHVSKEFTVDGTITNLAVTVGNAAATDYRGSVTVKNLKVVTTASAAAVNP